MLSLMRWSGGGAAVSKNRRGRNQAQEEGEEEEERGRGAAASLAKWRPVLAALLARARQHLPNGPGPCCSP
jgi:hypothetical protein